MVGSELGIREKEEEEEETEREREERYRGMRDSLSSINIISTSVCWS